MSTSFKNFKDLNDNLAQTYETRKVSSINAALDALSSVVYAAESVASEYAGLYSQVQWMKYSSDGDPDDVTPTQQLAIPDSVIAKLKSLVAKADQIYASISSGQEVVVPALDYIDLQIYGSVSPNFRITPNGGIQTGITQPDKIYKPNGLFQDVSLTYPTSYLEVVDQSVTPSRSRLLANATYHCILYEYRYGSGSFVIWHVNSIQSETPILALIQSATGDAKLAFLNEDNSSYSYFDVSLSPADQSSLGTFVLSQLKSMSGSGIVTAGELTNAVFSPSISVVGSNISFNPYHELTIDTNIDPDTLFHNYTALKQCINSL